LVIFVSAAWGEVTQRVVDIPTRPGVNGSGGWCGSRARRPVVLVGVQRGKLSEISPDNIFITHEAADQIKLPKPVPRLADRQFIMYVGRAAPQKSLGAPGGGLWAAQKKYPELLVVLAGRNDANYHRSRRSGVREANGRLGSLHRTCEP
jgi:hypothetical protein